MSRQPCLPCYLPDPQELLKRALSSPTPSERTKQGDSRMSQPISGLFQMRFREKKKKKQGRGLSDIWREKKVLSFKVMQCLIQIHVEVGDILTKQTLKHKHVHIHTHIKAGIKKDGRKYCSKFHRMYIQCKGTTQNTANDFLICCSCIGQHLVLWNTQYVQAARRLFLWLKKHPPEHQLKYFLMQPESPTCRPTV